MDRVGLTIFLATLLGVVPLVALFLAPKVITATGRTVGWYLRRKTEGRRAQILERVDGDEKALEADKSSRRNSDEEWENIESFAAGTAKNGEKADREWDGIVGFFHPFWYDS
jgi:alpha-1,2-mannosyltransferase